jgi:hypothetical protein
LNPGQRGSNQVLIVFQKFRANKEKWDEFGLYVQAATASVIESLAQTDRSQDDLKDRLEKLHTYDRLAYTLDII